MALFEFKLPDIGEGVVEGEIVKWLVKEGDRISEDQPLVEVMTDKAAVTIPSPKKGIVKRTHGKEGEIAKVHHPLVTLELDGAGAGAGTSASEPPTSTTAPAAKPAASAPSRPAEVSAHSATAANKVLATPVTRRMAREHGINLAQVAGSGPQGRVTKSDVIAAIDGASAVATGQVLPVNRLARGTHAGVSVADQRVPLKGLRRKIAEKMVRSKFTAPHFTFVEEMDATELSSLRKRINAGLAEAGEAQKISFLPFILKALVASLKAFPTLNANFDEGAHELVVKGAFNIGMAVATDDGLTVPVVKDVDRLSIRALADEIKRLGGAARNRKLKMDELSGGTFTVTSLGQTGGLFATPIINHPEVAILGVHKMRKRPVVVDDEIVIREMMYLSLSFDHRVTDGAVGADFTYALIRYLEHPELLMVDLT